MLPIDAVQKLAELRDSGDPEAAHGEADRILLAVVPSEVRIAYNEVRESVGFWYA